MTATARLAGITRSYKELVAVRDLDLELQPGVIYGLLGPNGAGKSTTIRTLLGLSLPDRGTVELFGAHPTDAARARVGYVAESRTLPELSIVRDLMVFFARMRGHDKAEATRRAALWIDKLALGDKADNRVKELSNGQQQKVQIALALMCDPDLVVLDEPLTGLDPTHQELVFRALREAAARGATVLLSTHRLREAEVLIEHVVMIAGGTKRFDAPLQASLDAAFDGVWRIRGATTTDWVAGPEVTSIEPHGPDVVVRLDASSPAALFARAAQAGAPLRAVEAVLPTLHDLFLKHVGLVPDAEPVDAA